MQVKAWGLDLATFEWVPTSITLNLDSQTTRYHDGVRTKLENTQATLERMSKSGWLLLPIGYTPGGDESLDQAMIHLIQVIDYAAKRFPGIILYGSDRYPDRLVTFQDNFWETVGIIDNKVDIAAVKRAENERQLAEQRAVYEAKVAALKPRKRSVKPR